MEFVAVDKQIKKQKVENAGVDVLAR